MIPLLLAALSLSPLERDVLSELQALRADPPAYARHAQALLPQFRGKLLERPGKAALQTSEGAAAVKEAIAVLRATPHLPRIDAALGITLAARQHANDIGASGSTEHAGSDGSRPADRMQRFGQWLELAGENLAFGPRTGRDVVLQLVIDDGVPSRGHRKNLLNPTYRVAGVACARHKVFDVVCVIDVAGGYRDRAGLQGDEVTIKAPPSTREPFRIYALRMASEGDRRWVEVNDSSKPLDRAALDALVRQHPELADDAMAKKARAYLAR